MNDLYIGNKNYSSWSLRIWLLMTHFGIPFVEHMESVDGRDNNPRLRGIAGNGKVPCLHVDGFPIWESLAIAEYLAEGTPDMWPAEPRARARARSIAAEMHAGFTVLRAEMPMNLKLTLKGRPAEPALQQDIDRAVAIWEEARTQFATDAGPYLFGAFSIADAMFAPVVWRLHIYNVPLPPVAAAYRDTMLAHPAMIAWRADALKEAEAHAHYDNVAARYGGPR